MRYLFLAIVVFGVVGTAGCSAFVAASATNEEDVVRTGTTKAELSKRLGEPLKMETFEHPISVWDVIGEKGVKTVIPRRDTYSSPHNQPSLDDSRYEAIEKAYYRFEGRLQGQHDVGEIVSINLMTFGVAEVALLPVTISETIKKHDHVLIAWFDKTGKAIAYQWGKIEELPE